MVYTPAMNNNQRFPTREAWLQALAAEMAPWFDQPVPPVRIGVGFTSKGGRSNSIGQCWIPEASSDEVAAIFLHPKLGTAEDVAHVLAHELVHASVGCDKKHGPVFRRQAVALGLAGPMTATVAGPEFAERVAPALAKLGPYPHGALAGAGHRKQTTRMHKVICGWSGCPFADGASVYTLRMSQKWIDRALPACPGCHTPMVLDPSKER